MPTTNILDMNNRIDELEKNSGGGGSADSAKRSDIATEFSTETSYTAGNFVYYEGKLYQFNADHSAGAWDPTDVVEANVTDQIVSNASAIAGLTASDIDYDNTDSGLTATDVQGALDELAQSYPAEKVMMSDGVTSVDSALDDLTGNYVISDSYSSLTKETEFVCPSDGYLIIAYNANCLVGLRVKDATGTPVYIMRQNLSASGSSVLPLFVLKGMVIIWLNESTNTSITFRAVVPS